MNKEFENNLKVILNKEAKEIYKNNKKEITKNEKKNNNFVLLFVISILCIIVIAYTNPPENGKRYLNGKDISVLINKKEKAEVKKVVDGDTIEVVFKTGILNDGRLYKIRLIGIDTPESKHMDENKNTKEGEIAFEYTKEKLEGKLVEVEFDIGIVDKYDRLLSYIWIEDTMYNRHLLEIGYAKILTIQPNIKYIDIFKKTSEEAKKMEKGFWKK